VLLPKSEPLVLATKRCNWFDDKTRNIPKSSLVTLKKGTVAKKKVVEFQNFATEQKLEIL
jgi:hypothetical protein